MNFVNKILLEAGLSGNIFDVDKKRAITIYNADKKEIVGIFSYVKLAAQFVYGNTALSKEAAAISQAARNKSKIPTNKNILGYNAAIRIANSDQITELGDKPYLIKNGELPIDFVIGSKAQNDNMPNREANAHEYWNQREKPTIKNILQTNLESINFAERILLEANIDQLRYEEDEEEDYKTITCFYDDEPVGFSVFEIIYSSSGYYEVNDVISEEIYDELVGKDYKFCIFRNMEINERYQNTGIGKELIKYTFGKIKSSGCNLIIINACPIGNKSVPLSKLIMWYKSFGFKELKHQGGNCVMYNRI